MWEHLHNSDSQSQLVQKWGDECQRTHVKGKRTPKRRDPKCTKCAFKLANRWATNKTKEVFLAMIHPWWTLYSWLSMSFSPSPPSSLAGAKTFLNALEPHTPLPPHWITGSTQCLGDTWGQPWCDSSFLPGVPALFLRQGFLTVGGTSSSPHQLSALPTAHCWCSSVISSQSARTHPLSEDLLSSPTINTTTVSTMPMGNSNFYWVNGLNYLEFHHIYL